MRNIVKFLMISMMTVACNNNSKAPEWVCGWEVTPDATIVQEQMEAHFEANPERWKATFEFLKTADLANLPLGEHEILGREVFAIVSEYAPKQHEDCLFENHLKYIDLQYVISGEEIMGVTTPDKVTPVDEHNEAKDIRFYAPEAEAEYVPAGPETFFVFFPTDIHRPSMKTEKDVVVKKVVVKVQY